MRASRLVLVATAVAALLAAQPAGADVLYKSVDANGRITFSDVPPPQGTKILEQREIRSSGSPVSGPASTGMPLAVGNGLDEALMRANVGVDQAEHALATARRDLWSVRDGLRLEGRRYSADAELRLARLKRDLQLARQVLFDVLKEKQVAAMQPGMPYTLAAR